MKKEYSVVSLLVESQKVSLIEGLLSNEYIDFVAKDAPPELLVKHGLHKELTPYQLHGVNSHQALMKYFRKHQEVVRYRDVNQVLVSMGWSTGAAGCVLDDFVKRGWVIKVERGKYRVTLQGLSADIDSIDFFRERIAKHREKKSA